MFRNTSLRSKPPVVVNGGAAQRVADAHPIDLWDAWLFAEAEASLSLQAWSSAATDDKAGAHAVYLAALDREEQAARVLADRLHPG
jgi:hypothetical protein